VRIKVPSTIDVAYPVFGLAGLGQCDDNGCPSTGSSGDDGSGSSVTVPGFDQTNPILNITTSPITNPSYTGGGAQTVPTPSGDYQIVNGTVFDPNGNVVSLSSLQSALGFPSSGTTPSSSAPNLAQILAAAAQATGTAVKAFTTLQGPSLIPGTNLVYNPATGQLSNAAGIGTSGTTSSLSTSLSTSGIMPLLLLAIAAVVLISATGRR
jgi:hypothetical protein